MKDKFEFNQLIKHTDTDNENISYYIQVSLDCTLAERALCIQNRGTPLDQVSQEYLDFIGRDKEGNKV